MAVPVAGQIIRASDVITYEDAKPRCHAYDSVGNVMADGVSKLILFDAEMYDSTGTMHGASTSRLIAPIDGIYRYSFMITMASATYTNPTSQVNIRQNAAGASGGGTSLQTTNFTVAGAQVQPSPKIEIVRALVAGDYLEAFVIQTSTASRTNITGAYATRAYMEYIASS
jgi:hypothetical protein